MDNSKYADDLREIREMMSRSSRFISLSGMSGIVAGILAIAGAWYAYRTGFEDYLDRLILKQALTPFDQGLSGIGLHLLLIAVAVLILSLFAGIYFTQRRAKAANEKIWNSASRRLLINLAIPLVTGGLVCLVFLMDNQLELLPPLSQIFYGLALVNASKYTLHEVRILGIAQLILGLIALTIPIYGIFFWALGFGVLHIVYGALVTKRYGK